MYPLTARVEAFWVGFGQASVLLGGLALVRVQTGALDPSEYASLALAMTVFSFGQMAVFGGLNHTITRLYALASRRGTLSDFRRYAGRRFVQAAAVWGGILCTLAIVLWGIGADDPSRLVLSVLPYSLLNGALSARIAMGNAARTRRLVAVHQAIDAGLKVALVAFITFTTRTTVPVLILAYAAASLLTLMSMQLWEKPELQSGDASSDNMEATFNRFSRPIYLWSPFAWGLLVADRWALQMFAGPTVLGLYAVAAQMTLGPARITMTAVLRYVAPRLFDRLEANDPGAMSGLHRAVRMSLIVTGVGFTVAFFCHEWVFGMLVAPTYVAASPYLPWLVLAAGLSATAELVVLRLFGAMNSAAVLRPRIVTAILGMGLIICGAFWFGAWGVIAAQVLHAMAFLGWVMARSAWRPQYP